jgi:hypothetical protein
MNMIHDIRQATIEQSIDGRGGLPEETQLATLAGHYD